MAMVLWICAHPMAATAAGTPEITGWAHQNIGDATARGNATCNRQARMWVVSGDGHDIYDSADGLHSVFQPLDGDGAVVARIDGLTAANAWAKSVMIRETLEAGSRWAYVLYAGPNGIRFQARVVTGAAAVSDTPVIRPEQVAVRAPLWVKLERKGDQFYGYYTKKEDGADTAWTPMAGSPRTISMAPTVYVGLAVTSHTIGTLCEARFSNVVVYPSEIRDAEIATDPGQALRMACARLQRLGDWRHDLSMIEEQGGVIANCLVTLARAREFRESAGSVLPAYYRVVELLPRSSPAADALARIVVLDGDKGLAYAVRHLGDRSKEDLDRFHVAVLRGVVDVGRIHEALGAKAEELGLHVVALHCYRRAAETKTLSLEGFELSASAGTKLSGNDPENEVWFWKGLLLADAEDFIAAADAYERFLRRDSESILAARAYYDLTRAKMAIGEEARSCMEKAKALSPCDAVVRLDRQLNAENSL